MSVAAAVAAPVKSTVTDREGRVVSIDAALDAGKCVVFVFWQTWCPKCKAEAPSLAKSAKAYADKAQFLGVISGPDDVVDDRRVESFIREAGLTYPQIRDRDLALTRGFAVDGTPTIIVMDPRKEVIYRGHHAPAKWSELFGS